MMILTIDGGILLAWAAIKLGPVLFDLTAAMFSRTPKHPETPEERAGREHQQCIDDWKAAGNEYPPDWKR